MTADVPTYFVDCGVFLRYFLEESPEEAAKIDRLFQLAARGEIRLETDAIILTEIVWSLEFLYQQSRSRIGKVVEAICDLPNLVLPQEGAIREAARVFGKGGVDFLDAYLVARLRRQGVATIVTCDPQEYARFSQVAVVLPDNV